MTIKQVEVVRDQYGYWTHPDYPTHWGEDTTEEEVNKWFSDNQIKSVDVWLQDDDEDLSERYFAGEIYATEWNPQKPTDDSFLLFIADTEDGCLALFATPIQEEI